MLHCENTVGLPMKNKVIINTKTSSEPNAGRLSSRKRRRRERSGVLAFGDAAHRVGVEGLVSAVFVERLIGHAETPE